MITERRKNTSKMPARLHHCRRKRIFVNGDAAVYPFTVHQIQRESKDSKLGHMITRLLTYNSLFVYGEKHFSAMVPLCEQNSSHVSTCYARVISMFTQRTTITSKTLIFSKVIASVHKNASCFI